MAALSYNARRFGVLAVILVVGGILIVNSQNKAPLSPGIEGKYQDPKGSKIEFIKDGTVVINMLGRQAVWKWTPYDGNRLKLEPSAGIAGATTAMCDYQLGQSTLDVKNCDYSMHLTRELPGGMVMTIH